ncbi:hypothetical protein F3157_16105 [Virgibacillus dakarensis]|nr:hypothetical protein [Virgibacillus dakarensis]
MGKTKKVMGIEVVQQTDCMGSYEKICTESKVYDKKRNEIIKFKGANGD